MAKKTSVLLYLASGQQLCDCFPIKILGKKNCGFPSDHTLSVFYKGGVSLGRLPLGPSQTRSQTVVITVNVDDLEHATGHCCMLACRRSYWTTTLQNVTHISKILKDNIFCLSGSHE